MSADNLFTRDEVLGGLPPTRRLHALLYQIESRTAYLAAGRRRVMDRFRSPQAQAEDELAFLEAYALGRDPPVRPTIQDLERFAPQWAWLAPEDARLRAGLAHLFGQKYAFSYRGVPGIRRALSLDSPQVQAAYERWYQEPLQSIYSERQPFGERLRWAWASLGQKLENLPPFWAAFAITLTETVGASILALPIALAGIGPLAGIVLLAILGLVNTISIIYLAEAMARTGSIRYEGAFLGRLVIDYLGRSGQIIFTISLALLNFLALLAYYVGFSTTLAGATQIRAEIWSAGLFLTALYFLTSRSLSATVASALLVGAVNIFLVLALSGLALTQFQVDNLLYVNVRSQLCCDLLNGQPFDPSLLQLVFGVVLAAYFGHSAIANCAAMVLRRDPSGRALMTGAASAQLAAITLYVIWLVAIASAIPAARLVSTTGTALIPLAAQVGPAVHMIGSMFVILGMGMASIHFSLGAFNLVREWLPARRGLVVLLPRRRGRLIFSSPALTGSRVHFSLVYLGLDGELPRFQLEVKDGAQTHVYEEAVSGFWEASGLFENLRGVQRRKVRLDVQVLEAQLSAVRVHVNSSLPVRYEGDWEPGGLGIADLLDAAPEQRDLVQWLLRQGEAALPALARHLDRSEEQTRLVLQKLENQGLVQHVHQNNTGVYRVKLAPKRGRRLPQEVWQALDESSSEALAGGRDSSPPRLRRGMDRFRRVSTLAFSDRARFLLGIVPVVLVFLLVEWMFLTHTESFSAPLNFAGVLVISLLSGAFPALLLVASRHKADLVPGFLIPAIGRPVFTVGIYLLSLANLFIHGLIIWDHPAQRLLALAVGLLMLAATWRMARSSAFSPRLVLEVRLGEPDEPGRVSSIQDGRAVLSSVDVYTGDGERRKQATGEIPDLPSITALDFALPDDAANELKVWVHRVNSQGESEPVPAWVDLLEGTEHRRYNLQPSRGQVVIGLRSPLVSPRSVRIFLKEPTWEGRSGPRSEMANAGY